MAEEKKKKRPSLTSGKGTFKYPRLNEPDYGNEKFPKPDGEFSVTLIKSLADAEKFINTPFKALEGKTLNELHAEAIAAGEKAFKELKVEQRKKLKQVTANPLFATIYDEETEEPTGNVSFKFAMKYKVDEWKNNVKTGKKRTNEMVIFDAKGLRMSKAPNIWGGTVGKVSFSPGAYFIAGTGAAGLKLALNAVQIIELVSNGAKSASGYGFEEEEGYAYEESTAEAKDEFADETAGGGASAGEGGDAAPDADF